LAGTIRAEAMLALANALFLVFLVLGGVVVPLDHLPTTLADVASYLPAAALSELFRVGLGEPGDPNRAIAVLGAWAIGSIAVAALTFRWE
jgi:ABC-2 type transport system permease protein